MLTHFRLEEFNCTHTNANCMDPAFLHKLDELREACGFPFKITSGYRSPSHSIEARKAKPGTHAQGIACDIYVSGGAQRHTIIKEAMRLGFTGIGVAKTFVHVDIRDTTAVAWQY